MADDLHFGGAGATLDYGVAPRTSRGAAAAVLHSAEDVQTSARAQSAPAAARYHTGGAPARTGVEIADA
jgi:hypothetical protein